MKLSVVVISWNDRVDIERCLHSLYAETPTDLFELIVTDNGSTDGSLEFLRARYPNAKVVANSSNLGFAAANNRAFEIAQGQYVLILNPDTVIVERAIEKLLAFADRHQEAGAFGCRVTNPDGSYQRSAHPIPTVRSYLIAALGLRILGRISESWVGDTYSGWRGDSVRQVGFQAGCCLLVRGPVLRQIGGFDENLFYQFEDADLCHRIARAGWQIVYTPDAQIVHVGGQNRGRYGLPVVLETHRSRYRFFHKHYGVKGANRIRIVSLISLWLRITGYGAGNIFRRSASIRSRVKNYRILCRWHWRINPGAFVKDGREPDLGVRSLRTHAG